MSDNPGFPVRPILLCLLVTIGVAGAAVADSDPRTARAPLLPRYQQECAACHTAYPPGLLPASSWRRIVNDLQRHYGADASVDPATANELTTWLAANAGTYRRVREAPPEDRITRSPWFIRKHHEVSATTWKLPAVKSAANCSACHAGSEQGDFNERNVRIPR